MKAFRNIYVKDYQKFPYMKLTGTAILNYTGKIIFYTGSLPATFDHTQDMAFDCDCEFPSWGKLNKVFR